MLDRRHQLKALRSVKCLEKAILTGMRMFGHADVLFSHVDCTRGCTLQVQLVRTVCFAKSVIKQKTCTVRKGQVKIFTVAVMQTRWLEENWFPKCTMVFLQECTVTHKR